MWVSGVLEKTAVKTKMVVVHDGGGSDWTR